MKVKNCLGVACLLLALCVSLFLNFGVNHDNPSLKMASNESNIALNGNQINTIFNSNQNGIQKLSTSHFVREVGNYNLADYLNENSYFTIDGTKVDEDFKDTVEYGDVIDIHLEWSLPNTTDWTTENTFSYELPAGFTFTNVQNGVIRNGAEAVGVYTISGNQVTIRYTDEEFLKLSNITGTLNVSGEITESAIGGGDGGRIDLEIPGVGTVIINVKPTSALKIHKSVKEIDTDTQEFTVEVTAITDNTNVVITDSMGQYLELITDSFKITKADSNQNVQDMTDKIKPTINGTTGFVYTIDKLNKGDVVTITYRANVLDGGFISSSTDNDLRNTARVKSDELPNEITATALVSTYKADVSKDGRYDFSDHTAVWTITVKPGEKGVTLKDVIADGQEITGDITVTESDDNGSSYHDSELTITADELQKGYTFAADATGQKVYKITFKTKATGEQTELYNEATIYVGENHSVSDDATVGLVPGVTISKYVKSADDREGVIHWNTKVTIPNIDGKQKKVSFKDVLGDGLTLDVTTVKVNDTSINETTNPKLEYNASKTEFTIDFGNIEPGKELNISYDTTFDNSESKTFYNTSTVTVDGEGKSSTGKYEYNKKDNYIQKYLNNFSDNFSKTGIARWEIKIDRLPKDVKDTYVTDTIPDGMEYVEGSAKLVLNYNPYTPYKLEPKLEDGKLIFDLDDYIDELSANSAGASIFYDSRLTDIFADQKTYTNKANITINDYTYPDVKESITGKVTQLLDKTAVYNTYTAPEVEYTIKVNEGKADIVKDSDTLVLDDEMGSALEFIRGSLKINGEAADPDSYEWNQETHMLTLHVPDSESLIITYKARVTLSAGEELNEDNAFNKVNLSGYGENSAESKWILKGEVLESSATSSGNSQMIYVYKYKDGDKNTPLADVEFNLYELGFTGSGNTFELTGEENLVSTLKTKDDGYASYSGINYDSVYKLVESKTVDGYILDTTVYYFVYPGNDGIEYPDSIEQYYQVKTFEVGNEYSMININVTKVWNDNDYENRPDSITVYLKRNNDYVYENGQKKSVTLSSSNNWQASFERLAKYDENHNRYDYTIEEAVPEHYNEEYSSESTVDDKNYTITNTLEDSNLTIQKVVGGNAGETDRYFTFKVILTDKNGNPLEESFHYTGSKEGFIKSGDTIKLKHGESITINGLPYGTLYEVTELEANSDRYETTATNDKGKITFDENKVVFTNTKNEGSLTIDKTVGGNSGETDRYFNFKVILYDENGEVLEGEYKYIGSKTGTIKSGDIIKLKHGESITIIGLPVGASYKVTELEADSDGYKTSVTNDGGVIGLEGNVSSFMNYKDVFEKPYQKANIPQTGGSDNTSLYGILTIAFGMLSVYLLKRRHA